MLLRVIRLPGFAALLLLALGRPARAVVTVTRTLQVDPGRLPAAGPLDLPDGQRITRVEVVSLECAEDGARAPAGITVRIGYQGFQRGRHLAWLELPDGCGVPAGHARHAMELRVRLDLEPSTSAPLPRERVVPDWEDAGGPPRASAERSQGRTHAAEAVGTPADAPRAVPLPRPDAATPFRPTQVPSLLGSPVAYLIIASDALVPAFQPLADWKTASGVPAAVRTLSFIREQYPAAVDDPERVRLFIRDAYSRWGTRWVLLGGDTELIPPRIAHGIIDRRRVLFPNEAQRAPRGGHAARRLPVRERLERGHQRIARDDEI